MSGLSLQVFLSNVQIQLNLGKLASVSSDLGQINLEMFKPILIRFGKNYLKILTIILVAVVIIQKMTSFWTSYFNVKFVDVNIEFLTLYLDIIFSAITTLPII